MKICPECGSHKVTMFDSDNDFCAKCEKWFPAVAEIPDGIDRIAAERNRQIEKEGYDAEHDQHHSADEFVMAAACYIWTPWAPHIWPWSSNFFKPSSKLRNLEKAGALIAAAIDRIQMENDKCQSKQKG